MWRRCIRSKPEASRETVATEPNGAMAVAPVNDAEVAERAAIRAEGVPPADAPTPE